MENKNLDIEKLIEENNKFKADLLKAVSQDIAKIYERLDKLEKRCDRFYNWAKEVSSYLNNRPNNNIIHNHVTTVTPRSRSFVEGMAIMIGFGDIFE